MSYSSFVADYCFATKPEAPLAIFFKQIFFSLTELENLEGLKPKNICKVNFSTILAVPLHTLSSCLPAAA